MHGESYSLSSYDQIVVSIDLSSEYVRSISGLDNIQEQGEFLVREMFVEIGGQAIPNERTMVEIYGEGDEGERGSWYRFSIWWDQPITELGIHWVTLSIFYKNGESTDYTWWFEIVP